MNKQGLERIVFCVTNDLNHDQRMARICGTAANWGHEVLLIGRKTMYSTPLRPQNYHQYRLQSRFSKGKLMYIEFNVRLFFKLLFLKANTLVAVDLDTIVPVYFISILKKSRRIYDAHELFTEMKEVITRPFVHRLWLKLEQFMLPRFPIGMTVSSSISEEFNRRYQISYPVIMNTPLLESAKEDENKFQDLSPIVKDAENAIENLSKSNQSRNYFKEKNLILYQGAVNEGRCLEWLIPAMMNVDGILWICGEGNFTKQCELLIKKFKVDHKVFMKGMVLPEELRYITQKAYIGINLVEPTGLNQIYSLANKFFDYMHAGLPQISMNFPEYQKINDDFEIAVLIDKPDVQIISDALNKLMQNLVLYQRLESNCLKASKVYNWQIESPKLAQFFPKN